MADNTIRILNDVQISASLSFATNYTDFPANPGPRALVVKDGVPYIYTELVNGSGYYTWTPVGFRQSAHLHTQGTAATSWTVTHNFNTPNFGYFVYDADHHLVLASIELIDNNSFTVSLSEAITGTVVVFSMESIFTGVVSASSTVNIATITLRDASGKLTVNNNEVAMQSALAAEATARAAADTALGARIDAVITNTDSTALNSLAEVVTAFQSADSTVNGAITSLAESASTDLAAEVTRATAAEGVLTSAVAAISEYSDAKARAAISVTGGGTYNSATGVINITGTNAVSSVAGRTGAVVLSTGDIGGLATVATSGLYSDLSGTPTIPSAYTLPVATASVLGGVKQGTNITIAADGTISSTGGGSVGGTVDSLTVTGAITQNGGLNVGYLEVPQRATGTATLVLADSGKHIFNTTASQVYTIPANAAVAYPIGTALMFVNQGSGTCSIAISNDTMYSALSGTTGTRNLAAYGIATALKTSATTWMISGNGLT